MVSDKDRIKKNVYVVDSHIAINDRVTKLVTLRHRFNRMILVKAGHKRIEDQLIEITPLLNPVALLQRLKLNGINRLLEEYVYFPSAKVFYARAVSRKLSKLIKQDLKKNQRVCVLTCLPSHDLVMTGLILKRRFPQIEWIIDWQDLWSYDKNYYGRIPTYYKKRVLKLEADALRTSDLNITTNKHAKEVLEEEYKVDPNRVVAVHHHFSPDDINTEITSQFSTNDLKHKNSLRIGFLGVIFKPPRVPGRRVLEAVEYVRSNGEDLELHLFGDIKQNIERKAAGLSVEGVVAHGRFPHQEALEKVSECDFLLLVLSDLPNSRAVMSIKLPHYLSIGKPIIAIVPDNSAVADIIRDTGSGFVIPAASEHWGKELDKTIKMCVSGNSLPCRNTDAISAFSWENISREWLKVLSA